MQNSQNFHMIIPHACVCIWQLLLPYGCRCGCQALPALLNGFGGGCGGAEALNTACPTKLVK